MIVDTTPGLGEHTLVVLEHVTDAVFVTNMGVPSLRAMRTEFDLSDANRPDARQPAHRAQSDRQAQRADRSRCRAHHRCAHRRGCPTFIGGACLRATVVFHSSTTMCATRRRKRSGRSSCVSRPKPSPSAEGSRESGDLMNLNDRLNSVRSPEQATAPTTVEPPVTRLIGSHGIDGRLRRRLTNRCSSLRWRRRRGTLRRSTRWPA